MKKYSIILLVLINSISFGQSKKEILLQKWKLDKVEEFGQEYSPMENQKNDKIEFNDNSKFTGVIEGNHVEGSWSISGSKVTLSINKELSITKFNWIKVKQVESEKFVIEYQNGDLITATLLFIPFN
jgi:heat shock protein HslJ